MRRFVAIVLLALLPFQFTWATLASYCGHESPSSSWHVCHHDHGHHAGVHGDARLAADPGTGLSSAPDEAAGSESGKAPGAMDADCGHCHGSCSVMPTWPLGLPGVLSGAPPRVSLDEKSGAHAPTRPERPQWRPLA